VEIEIEIEIERGSGGEVRGNQYLGEAAGGKMYLAPPWKQRKRISL
jgi:hypothetical protein